MAIVLKSKAKSSLKPNLTEGDILTIAAEVVALVKRYTDSYEGCINVLAAARAAIAGSDLVSTEDFGLRLRSS